MLLYINMQVKSMQFNLILNKIIYNINNNVFLINDYQL